MNTGTLKQLRKIWITAHRAVSGPLGGVGFCLDYIVTRGLFETVMIGGGVRSLRRLGERLDHCAGAGFFVMALGLVGGTVVFVALLIWPAAAP